MSLANELNQEELSPTTEDIDSAGKRKKKFTGGNASKRHRDRVNVEFNNLAKLLPFPENVISKLDKSSILRLAVSYIRAKSFFQDALGKERHILAEKPVNVSPEVKSDDSDEKKNLIQEGRGLVADIFTNALDGFLLVLTEDMKVLFVSESVRDYLGYCQAGIIHENFLQFVNPSDHDAIYKNLEYTKSERTTSSKSSKDGSDFNGRRLLENEVKDENNGSYQDTVKRQFVCRMKCAFSCSSRFYTAYRNFEFNGHLRHSTIQEGREQKYLKTLVVFATPSVAANNNTNNNAQTENGSTSSAVNDMEARTAVSLPPARSVRPEFTSFDQRYSHGFRIDPTLRPHIAPIPVSNADVISFERHSPPPPLPHVKAHNRPPPQLLNVNEAYSKDQYLLSQALSSSPYLPRVYNAPRITESRYSDYSDDSKCSPASSPNLLWKRSENVTPVSEMSRPLLDRFKYESDRSILESEIRDRLRPGFRFYDAYRRSSPPDIHNGANILMKLRQGLPSQHQQEFERLSRKRAYIGANEPSRLSPKRQFNRSTSSPPNRGFHISSLLGLDENKKDTVSSSTHEENIDVCGIGEERQKLDAEARCLYRDLFYMRQKLDRTFHKTMTVNQ